MNQNLDEVYVVGAFTDWRLEEAYKMQYINKHNGYHVTIPMKQGVYNYLFATKGADGKPSYAQLEGDSENTVNYYTTILYYRDFIPCNHTRSLHSLQSLRSCRVYLFALTSNADFQRSTNQTRLIAHSVFLFH